MSIQRSITPEATGIAPQARRGKVPDLDGEAVVCGPDGIALFDALHRRVTVAMNIRRVPVGFETSHKATDLDC